MLSLNFIKSISMLPCRKWKSPHIDLESLRVVWNFAHPPWKDPSVHSLRNRSAFRSGSRATSVCAPETQAPLLQTSAHAALREAAIFVTPSVSMVRSKWVKNPKRTHRENAYRRADVDPQGCRECLKDRTSWGLQRMFFLNTMPVSALVTTIFWCCCCVHLITSEVNICFLSRKQSQCQDLVSRSISTRRPPFRDISRGNK